MIIRNQNKTIPTIRLSSDPPFEYPVLKLFGTVTKKTKAKIISIIVKLAKYRQERKRKEERKEGKGNIGR